MTRRLERRGGSNVLGGRLNDLLLSPKRVCPECRAVVPWRSVDIQLTWSGIPFCECPLCGIGAPKRDWKTPQTVRRKHQE